MKRIPALLLILAFASPAQGAIFDRVSDHLKVGRATTSTKVIEFDTGDTTNNAKIQAADDGHLTFSVASLSLANEKAFRFYEATGGGTNYVGLKAPAAIASDFTMVLPDAAGTANQILGTNAGATALEHKTLSVGTSGTDFAIAHSAGGVAFNLPDASASNRGAVTTGAQTFAGAKTFGDMFFNDQLFGSATTSFVGTDSADGSDSKSLYLLSTDGASGTGSRGAQIGLFGNEVATVGGQIQISAGRESTAAGSSNAVAIYAAASVGATPTLALAVTGSEGTDIKGTTTNDSAAAGFVGQELRSYTASGSACSLTSGDQICNVASLSITAGDWDVTCICAININGATASGGSNCQLTSTSDTLSGGSAFGDSRVSVPVVPTSSQDLMLVVPSYRVSQASSTTWYCVVNSGVSAGTALGYGRISARRMRFRAHDQSENQTIWMRPDAA